VKLVRQKHLLDLGSQSYGSLVRREVRELAKPQIEFLGSGQLATEILPWLMKALKTDESGAAAVSVHARNPVKARERLEKATAEPIEFFGLEHGPCRYEEQGGRRTRVLIIAAPIAAQEIAKWVRDSVHYDLIIDLRGESRHDSLSGLGLTKSLRALEEVFSSIENAREIAGVKKAAALGLIEQRVAARGATATHRPFGWDDVWS
jgi:glutamyl-tRNA reductase